jgi:hypothetical protein
MRKSSALLGAGALVAATAGLAVPASAADGDAQLSVLHAIPASVLDGAVGTTDGVVDVYVNDALTLDDFAPGDLEGPLSVPAGTYTVDIVGGSAADNSSPALSVDLPLESGKNYTAVAHLDAAGSPKASLFTNDTAAAGAGEGKVTVRHAAANAEGVEIVANGETSLGTFNNGEELGPVALPAGTISAEIKAGDTVVPPTPADVPVTEGQNTIVYAWGDAADGEVKIAVQTVALGHSAPAGVPGGESGAAAGTVPGWIFAAAGLGIAGIALSGRRFATAAK